MSGIILLHFDESAALQPSDSLGNLEDLGTETGIVAPGRVSTWAGFGRQFLQASTNGLVAPDKSSNGTLLLRDLTIQALLSLTLTGASGPQTLIARGLNDGTASERYAYGLELQEQAAFPGFVEVRWFWQDSSGTIRTQAPGVFRHPGDGVEFMLTATRRWQSTTSVVVRYYVNDQLVAELASTNGDISGGTTGHTTIGARKASGSYGRYLNGVVDELAILDIELSLEEIRHTWKRLTEYQPGGVETFAGLMPPGARWYANPGNDIGRKAKIVGQLLGLVVAGAEEVRALSLPDAAPIEKAAQWEGILDLTTRPGDSLDVRRARLVGFLSHEEAFDVPTIQQALSEPMDLAPSDVQILEFTNTVTDGFASIGSQWFDGQGATWSIIPGALQAFAAAGSDLRWEDRKTPFLLQAAEPFRLYVAGTLLSFATIPQSTFMGLALHNRDVGEWLWFGIYNNGGTLQLGYRTAAAGAAPGAWNSLVSPTSIAPYWLRIATSQAQGFTGGGPLTLSWSTTSATSGFTSQQVSVGTIAPNGWHYAGFALFATVASTAADTTVTFDDFVLHTADSVSPFVWYAYRNPALPGAPDMAGADALVRRTKPAYTHAAAIAALQCICDDLLNGRCDAGPCV